MRRAILSTMPWVAALVLTGSACAPDDPGSTPGPAPTAVDPAVGTDPGTDLAFGEEATVVWQPESDVQGVLDLSVDAVAEQAPSVFDGWASEVVPDARAYFVTVSLANAGEADLGGQDVPLYLRDDTGALGAPWTLGGDFAACQSGPLPTPFAAGEETSMCLVYLVPERGRSPRPGLRARRGLRPDHLVRRGHRARPREAPHASEEARPRLIWGSVAARSTMGAWPPSPPR